MYISAHGNQLVVLHFVSPVPFVQWFSAARLNFHYPGVLMPTTTDRRQSLRTKLDQVAYIHIQPDNGAIVLNASGDGLSFHSMAPVNRAAPLRFSVQEQNRHVDICGELVWTDELQKIGGVRFDTLSAEAREQILDWIGKTGPVPAERPRLGAVLLKALPTNGRHRSVFSFKPALAWWKSARHLKVSGFRQGLASGFLLSLLAFSVVLVFYAHRREIGESLVRLGERLGAKQDPGVSLRAAPSLPVPENSAGGLKQVVPVVSKSASAATPSQHAIVLADEKRPVARPLPAGNPDPAKSNQAISPTRDLENTTGSTNSVSSPTQPIEDAATTPGMNAVMPLLKQGQPPIFKASQPATLMGVEAGMPITVGVSPVNANSDVEMFFEVGRFRKDWMARDLSKNVAQLGIRTLVVQRGHLWLSSYQVLAGPYHNEAAEKQLKNELLSHGYNARPYERGSRDFSFRTKVSVRGSQLPDGDVTITWETYVADTKVKLMQGRHLVAAVDGKWVQRDAKFSNNEYVYQNQRDGSHPLTELHFAGMDRSLMLQNLP